MSKIKLCLTLLLGTMLTGCHSIEGTFNAYRDFQANNKSNKSFSVSAGRYDAKLTLKSKKDIRLKLKDVQGTKDQELKFKIPSGQDIPKEQGSFYLKGSDIGQSFDVSGSVDTQRNSTQSTSARENCSETFTEYQCRYTPYYDCGTVYITRYGFRDVTYHYENTLRTYEVTLGDNFGTFQGKDTDSSLVYDYYGSCITY